MQNQHVIRLQESFNRLQQLRRKPLIVYCSSDQFPKNLAPNDVVALYTLLLDLAQPEELDFFLFTDGGSVDAGRRLALLLRSHTKVLNILVPYRVKSAGTLLCLGANQLILGPLAEFSPIDPYIGSSTGSIENSPQSISSEEVRIFGEMAREWFGLSEANANELALNIMCQHIFPTTISSFFRADKQVRIIGEELLEYQLPELELKERREIVNLLIRGFYSHNHCIMRNEIIKMGLSAEFASTEESRLMWDIFRQTQKYMIESSNLHISDQRVVNALMITDGTIAHHITRTHHITTNQTPTDTNLEYRAFIEQGWDVL